MITPQATNVASTHELCVERYARLNLEVLKVKRVPTHSRRLADLLIEWGLHTQPQECFWVIAHDANGNIHTVVEVARGAHTGVEVHLPSLLSAVLMSGSEAFAVAHNHPTLNSLPSLSDHDLTHKVMDAANACGLMFEEHVIVEPGGDFYSFRDSGLLIPASRNGGPLDAVKAAPARGRRVNQ